MQGLLSTDDGNVTITVQSTRYVFYRCESCNLVAKTLCLNDSDILCHPLVGVKVECQLAVVLLHEHP